MVTLHRYFSIIGIMSEIKSEWKENRRVIDEAALRNFPWTDTRKWFVHKDRLTDLDAFFGPLTGEEQFIEIDDKTNIFHVLAKTGAFPSATMARKHWKNIAKATGLDENDTTVPDGFTMFVVGKKKFDVVILK